jgi:hypothetical protein
MRPSALMERFITSLTAPDPIPLRQRAEAELADLDDRLKEAQSGRARAEARCLELTSDVERLSAAGEALESLESLVRLVRRSP